MTKSEELSYTLSKQIPCLASGFVIETHYGPIRFEPLSESAETHGIMVLIEAYFEKLLEQAKEAENDVRN